MATLNEKDRTLVTAGNVKIVMFDQSIIDLQRELAHKDHQDLRLRWQTERDFGDCVAGLCGELGIVMDGMYTPSELLTNIVPELISRLRKKRGALIVIGATDI